VTAKFPLRVLAFSVAAVLCSPAATLIRLSMEEMAQKSTAIVRGKVVSTRTAFRGPMIYTFATIQVEEQWKGAPAATVEVATPGGRVGNQEQSFSGSPKLTPGASYLFFLWTGKNGMTQIIGLCQGLFDVRLSATGEWMVSRPAITEMLLDPQTRQPVSDDPAVMRLKEMSARISRALAGSMK